MAMNLNSIGNRIDSNRGAEASANRAVATADPMFDAGMDDATDPFEGLDDLDFGNTGDSGGVNDPFGTGGGGGVGDPFGAGGASSPFGMSSFGVPQQGGFGTQQAAPAEKSPEDKFYEVAGKAGKASIGFFKALVNAFKTCTAQQRAYWGRNALIMGIIVAIAGLVLMLLGFRFFVGLELLTGGLLSTAIGIPILCFAQSSISSGAEAPSVSPMPEPEQAAPAASGDSLWDDEPDWDNQGFSSDDTGFDDFPDDSAFDDEPAEQGDSSGSDIDWGASDWSSPSQTEQPEDTSSGIDAAINSLSGIEGNGLYDRRSLFEKQMSVLTNISSDFSAKTPIAEGSDLFKSLDALAQESGEQFKSGNTNELTYLIAATDTLFYIRLEINRAKYIKNVDAYTQEIVNIFQYDRETGIRDNSIYGVGEIVGSSIFIKLMKGESAFVGLKDVYKAQSEKILDYNNKMPIVLGVNIEGAPVIVDFGKIDSILITGMPRSGKTWLMLAVLYQMMCYMSPEELQFYIMDPKGKMSDFAHSITPHVRAFITRDEEILAQLKYIVRVEGARRKELIGNAGFVNIQDYNKANPENKLSYLYVVIDEVVTLAERMEKDILKEFQGLLFELVSQLPAAGVRIFMVPHLVKDTIIKKNTTTLIGCRISVCGNAKHIEDSCDVKNFQYSLTNVGDTCTVLKGIPDPMFIHAIALAKSNDENKGLFRFLASLWAKVCPNTVAGSCYERVLNGTFMDSIDNKAPAAVSASNTGSTRAAEPHVSAMQDEAFEPVTYAEPIQNSQSIDESMQSGDSWGNNITMNGETVNTEGDEEFDLFDDEF